MQISCCSVLFRSYLNWGHFSSGWKASNFWSVLGCRVNTTLRNKHNKLRQKIHSDHKARKFLTCSISLNMFAFMLSNLTTSHNSSSTSSGSSSSFSGNSLGQSTAWSGLSIHMPGGKRLTRMIKCCLAGKWLCAHPHTTKPTESCT